MKRDTHKEIEKKRRENINAGINTLAKMIPNEEKNKGRILQGTIAYIHDLRAQEALNLEKWSMEKMMMEQLINDYKQKINELENENLQLKSMLNLPSTYRQNSSNDLQIHGNLSRTDD
ncbi:hypothetical protein BC833DRAFT_582587 [Globomyces pollinis-pini]|nr:hypothetical protein BC833DRAFT_582587 [Globomyces pollinis-pini]